MKRSISAITVAALLISGSLSATAANPKTSTIPIDLPVPQIISFENALKQYEDIPTTAWRNVQDVIAENADVRIPTTIVVGPTTNTTSQIVTNLLKREYRLWRGFNQVPSYAGIVYNAKDQAWAESRWIKLASELNLTKSPSSYINNHLRAGCAFSAGVATECYAGMSLTFPGKNSGFAFFGVQEGNFWEAGSSELGPISQVTHEYAHSAQFAQWIGSKRNSKYRDLAASSHENMPCWFSEGQANAIGIAVVAENSSDYLKARDNSVRRLVNKNMPIAPSLTETGLTENAITNFLTNQKAPSCYYPSKNGDYQLGYSIGYAAVEALIAIGGPQATLAIQRKNALGLTWKKAFKSVYGISWEKGMSVLGKVLAAEYAAKPMNHR